MTLQLEVGTPMEMTIDGSDLGPLGLGRAVENLFASSLPGFERLSSVAVTTEDGLLPARDVAVMLLACRPTARHGVGALVWEVHDRAPVPSRLGTVTTVHRVNAMTAGAVSVGEVARSSRIEGPLPIGERHIASYAVTSDMTTGHVAGRLPLLSTPALVGCMEQTAKRLADPHLAPGHAVVGFEVDIRHVAPAVEGQTVEVSAVLIGRRRHRLHVAVDAVCDGELIGRGRVTSHVVTATPG